MKINIYFLKKKKYKNILFKIKINPIRNKKKKKKISANIKMFLFFSIILVAGKLFIFLIDYICLIRIFRK
jgi:hypothetical protein